MTATLTPPVESPVMTEGKAEQDLASIAKRDQQAASERDKLVRRGFALVGIGLTRERISWANDCLSYARLMGESAKGANEILDEIQRSMLHMGNSLTANATGKRGNTRIAGESFRLACVAQVIPQVKLLDWGAACLFLRFLDKYNPVAPTWVFVDEGKAIAANVVLRKPEYCNKNGYLDTKKIREAIDAILGKSRKSPETVGEADGEESGEDGTESVTSLASVVKWLESASADDIGKLASSLSPDAIARIAETFVPLLK